MEPTEFGVHAMTALAVAGLIFLFNFGIWSRSFILPTPDKMPIRKQLVAGVPSGLITMGFFGKAALPGLVLASPYLVFDVIIVMGNAIIFGMMSRETLDRLLKTVKPPTGHP